MGTFAVLILSVVKACISTIRFPSVGASMPPHAITTLRLLLTMALVLIPSPDTRAMAHASMMRITMESVMSWKCWVAPTLKRATTTPSRRVMMDRVNSLFPVMIAMETASMMWTVTACAIRTRSRAVKRARHAITTPRRRTRDTVIIPTLAMIVPACA